MSNRGLGLDMPSHGAAFRVDIVASGMSHPWGIDFLPDGRMIVTERRGTMRIVSPDGAVSAPLRGVPKVLHHGQGGLLDVALHPEFDANRLVYFSYSEPGPGGASTAVARAVLSGDAAALDDTSVIFSQQPKVRGSYHFGSRIVFDGKGHVFVGLGERFSEQNRLRAQDLTSHFGKIVRLNEDGSPAGGNPFAGRRGALPEIWSYGHRNIQAMAIHPDSGELWEVEHGPLGGDELNIARPGLNYGWPIVSYGRNYDGTPVGSGRAEGAGFEPPLVQWTPVIAPSGMMFYGGTSFPAWRGNLFIGGLASTALVRLTLDGDKVTGEERLLVSLGLRIRDVAEGPEGEIYVLTDEDPGHVLKLTPTG
jgi:aldose sugar dehydrogenase